jgi:hypothetical protein
MLFLLLFSLLSLTGPVFLMRQTLQRRRWSWGSFSLTVIYWHGLLCVSGILTGLIFGRFSSLSFGAMAAGLGILIAAFLYRRPRFEDEAKAPAQKFPHGWELTPLVLLAVVVAAWNLFALDVLPVRVWESLSYRVVTVGMWMQGAPLRGFEASSWASFSYPANTELLELWWCIHPHTDRWIEMPQWLSALALADTVGLLALDAGLSSRARWWAAALTLLIPIVGIQAATEQNDLVTCSAFAAGLVFLRRMLSNERPAANIFTAIAAGMGLGVALGSKVTIIPLIVPVALWVLFSLRRLSWKPVVALKISILLTGTFFYLDNLFRLGNPLYPFPVRLFGMTIFEEDRARGVPEIVPGLTNLLNHLKMAPAEWFEAHTDDPAYCESSGFGGVWIAITLSALLVMASAQPPWRSSGRARTLWCLAAAVAAGQVLLWSNTIWTQYDLRYELHVPALALVAAAACWQRCPRPWRALPSLAAIALSLFTAMNVVGNNWNSPLSRIFALRKVPFNERTYARMATMPEAKLFAAADANGTFAESRSLALISNPLSLKSAAFGPEFERKVWLPDAKQMDGSAAAGRWRREVDARDIDTVLIIDHQLPWQSSGFQEARADLENPSRWTRVYDEQLTDSRLLAYRRNKG